MILALLLQAMGVVDIASSAQYEPREKRCFDPTDVDVCEEWTECHWWLYDDLVRETIEEDGSTVDGSTVYSGKRHNGTSRAVQVTLEELSEYFRTRLNPDGNCRFGVRATDAYDL